MSANSNSKVYVLPFMPMHDNQCSVLNQTSFPITSTVADETDMLKIRITEMPKDSKQPQDCLGIGKDHHSGPSLTNTDLTAHQEVDLDTLNQLFSREFICVSTNNSTADRVLQCQGDILSKSISGMTNSGAAGRPKSSTTTKTLTSSGHLSIQNLDALTDKFIYENPHKKRNTSQVENERSDGYVVFTNDGGFLNEVELIGLTGTDENLWIANQSGKINPQSEETSNLQLVPIEIGEKVVYINAVVPSVGDGCLLAQTASGLSSLKTVEPSLKEKPSVSGNVLSFVVDDKRSIQTSPLGFGRGSTVQAKKQNQNQGLTSELRKIAPKANKFISSAVKLTTVSSVNTDKSNKFRLNNSRSVLKTSVIAKNRKTTASKINLCKKNNKEEHISLLISQCREIQPQKGIIVNKNTVKLTDKLKKPPAMAFVAISSNKTKDLTEIIVNTPKGEQVFKGKTSELISSTPSLWCLNSKQTSVRNSGLSSQNKDCTNSEEEDPVDDKPMSDALNLLGIPIDALKCVQSKSDDEERMWFCPEKGCKRLFSRLHLLKVHILGHYGVRPYKCDFPSCQWAFYTHFKLKRHQVTHLQRKDFKCDVPGCGRSFTTVYNLNSHQRLHKRPAEIACPAVECSLFFQTRRGLEHHLKEHGLDHAPYVCPYASCQKRYYTVNSMNSHVRSHQHKDDEIKCQWTGCTKVFTKPCRLKAHMRTHTGDKPYPCTHPGCNWAFSSSSKLKRHQQKHTNIRKFECRVEGCGKLFMRSEHLKEHALTHSSERTFHCPHPNCNLRFSAKSSLYVHSKKHRARIPSNSASIEPNASPSQTTNNQLTPPTVVNSESELRNSSVMESGEQIVLTASTTTTIFENTRDLAPLACPIDNCKHTFNSKNDLQQHFANVHIASIDGSQQLQLLSLLTDDEPSNALSNTSVSHIDDGEIMAQVDVHTQDPWKDDDTILCTGSARSSITYNKWRKFKMSAQKSEVMERHQQRKECAERQQSYCLQDVKLCDVSRDDHSKSTPNALINSRAPLDVVLGAGLLGVTHDSIAQLLLPDELGSSSDLYSTEDGILSMETSFVPSTINLRDLD